MGVTPRFLIFLLLLPLTLRADQLSRDVLAEINLARTQPQHYAGIVAATAVSPESDRDTREAVAFLQAARPLPPLAWSPGIGQAALGHALDAGPRGAHGHTGSRGSTPWRRMSEFGQWQGKAGENIDYGHSDPRAIVIALIVDRGVSGRGHRANLFNRHFGVAGIAVAPHAVWGSMCVMDFATDFVEAGEQRLVDRAAGGLHSIYSGRSFF
jgi:uncharacterized protein YkwD